MSDAVAVAEPKARAASQSRYTAVVTDDAFADLSIERSVLEPIGCAVVPLGGSDLTRAETADALLVSRAHIDAALIERASRLKVIARYGVGVENIDLDAAARRGIAVVNTPDYCVEEVAEHVLAQILACARQLVRLDRVVHAGRWSPSDMQPTRRLSACVLGLVGLGQIGSAVARRAQALGLEVVAADPYVETPPSGVALLDLDDLLERADFISLHAPLTPVTRHLIGAKGLARMKPTAFLINAARGGLVDEQALAAALREGRLAGAALDVLSFEPPPPDHPLLGLENVLLTPHVAFYSEEALELRKRKAAEGVRAVLEGRRPDSAVTPEPEVKHDPD